MKEFQKTGTVDPEEDLLGFCEQCVRVRWLADVKEWKSGTPFGTCRQCARENAE